jgi:SpoVK/Ycf46/Vps4 family AAA+-type ATPase
MSFQDRLSTSIRARFPIIYITSAEELRVRKMLENIAEDQNKELFCWSLTNGWTDVKDNKVNIEIKDATQTEEAKKEEVKGLPVDVSSAIKAIKTVSELIPTGTGTKKGRIYVLSDFHWFLENSFIERGLRDCARKFPYCCYDTIIIVSPIMKLPDSLNKDVTILDMELPEYAELKVHIEKFIDTGIPKDVVVDLTEEDKEILIKASCGLTLAEAENAFARAIVTNKRLSREDINLIIEEKKQIVRKSGTLEYFETDISFNSVGGLKCLKDWMRKRKSSFNDKAKEYGLPSPKGVLLLGAQGAGKSMVCKTLGSLWEMPVLRFDISSIFGKYVGESENNMRKALATAEAVAPCILWIDELEKGFSGMMESSDSGTSSRVLSHFLSWMQDNKKPIFVIATSNDVQKLPPELLRKGRLDDIFFIDLPCTEEREEIIGIHLALRNRNVNDYCVSEIAKATVGFSGAEIEQAIVSALYDAYDEDREVETSDIVRNANETAPISRTMKEKVEFLRRWAKDRAHRASPITVEDEINGSIGL